MRSMMTAVFIIQSATIPIETPGHQNDLAEVFENVADSIMRDSRYYPNLRVTL